ncbi:hypothetical protein PR048_031075 [Dryococelus australis]|uniref:Uncharacterized protein n=1 Tax=Dryococelus australis TaxID=614101 RepID=A0ABQ9G481_9NEOP|nr:hypothetical protein PR048_031075 [Dryococelus australis]
MEQRRNARAGGNGRSPKQNPPTSGSPRWEADSLTAPPPRPRFSWGSPVFASICIPALLRSHLISPSSVLKTALLRNMYLAVMEPSEALERLTPDVLAGVTTQPDEHDTADRHDVRARRTFTLYVFYSVFTIPRRNVSDKRPASDYASVQATGLRTRAAGKWICRNVTDRRTRTTSCRMSVTLGATLPVRTSRPRRLDVNGAVPDLDGQSMSATGPILSEIALPWPITTANEERSFSTLRRLKTYLHCAMGEDRLGGLALVTLEQKATAKLMQTKDSTDIRASGKFEVAVIGLITASPEQDPSNGQFSVVTALSQVALSPNLSQTPALVSTTVSYVFQACLLVVHPAYRSCHIARTVYIGTPRSKLRKHPHKLNFTVPYILERTSLLHWLLHSCEATPFLTELRVIGAHNCEVSIYWRRVTQDVPNKAWSNDKLDPAACVTARDVVFVAGNQKAVRSRDGVNGDFLRWKARRQLADRPESRDLGWRHCSRLRLLSVSFVKDHTDGAHDMAKCVSRARSEQMAACSPPLFCFLKLDFSPIAVSKRHEFEICFCLHTRKSTYVVLHRRKPIPLQVLGAAVAERGLPTDSCTKQLLVASTNSTFSINEHNNGIKTSEQQALTVHGYSIILNSLTVGEVILPNNLVGHEIPGLLFGEHDVSPDVTRWDACTSDVIRTIYMSDLQADVVSGGSDVTLCVRIRTSGNPAITSHQGEPGSISSRVTPGSSQVGIAPDGVAARQVSSGISPPPPPAPSFRRCSFPASFHNHRLSTPRPNLSTHFQSSVLLFHGSSVTRLTLGVFPSFAILLV